MPRRTVFIVVGGIVLMAGGWVLGSSPMIKGLFGWGNQQPKISSSSLPIDATTLAGHDGLYYLDAGHLTGTLSTDRFSAYQDLEDEGKIGIGSTIITDQNLPSVTTSATPGSGAITGLKTGLGLVGGGTSGSVTVALNPGVGLAFSKGKLVAVLGDSIDLASNETVSVLPVTKGGTGLSDPPTANEVLVGTGTGYTYGLLSDGDGTKLINASGQLNFSVDATVCRTSGNCAGAGGTLVGSNTSLGYVPRLTSSGTLGDSSIYDNGTDVGVNTTSPQSTLSVNGGVVIGSYASTSAAPSNGLIVSGNVGIGTPSPSSALSVNSTVNPGGVTFTQNQNNTYTLKPTADDQGVQKGLSLNMFVDSSNTHHLSRVWGGQSYLEIDGSGIVDDAEAMLYRADNDSSGTVSTLVGGDYAAFNFGNNGLGNATHMYGLSSTVTSYVGTTSDMHAVDAYVENDATTTSMYGLSIEADNYGTLTNRYGVYYKAPVGSATNDYGLYIAGTTNKNYLGSVLGIGTTTPKSKLDVSGGVAIGSYSGVNAAPSNGLIVSGNIGLGVATGINSKLTFAADTTAAGGILFGTDTNLYRSAASTLATDSLFNSIGGLQIGSGGTTIKKFLSSTATWDPASVATGAMTSTTITVTGAALGDTVVASFTNAVPAGMVLSGQVTSANTVTVTLLNMSGSTQDLASGTLRADVWQH